jgi:cellulose synthase/poly-beta-1,6-N-acetylglucosamine synthase-like glycosyltransferase
MQQERAAKVAGELGATVVERFDEVKRGKGYALAYGVEYLESLSVPPDVVIIIDADCIVHEGVIEKLATLAVASGKPIQSKYLMAYPPNPTIKDSISGFAFLVKNWVRLLGLKKLGFPSLLTGTGMAFPWELIKNAPLASGNIVEDMQLGIDLAIAGHPPLFCPSAEVTGQLPQYTDNATQQRTRWEHGHIKTLLSQVPQLLKAGLSQKRLDLIGLAADLSIPPLSLLVMIWGGVTLITLIFRLFGLGTLPLIISGLAGIALFSAIIMAWGKFARDLLPLSTLLMVPLYLLWKVPIYFAFLVRPQSKWNKTARENNN